jgi:hypothetical protein
VIITSNQRSMAHLGTGVPVDVFSEPEALAFLAERTGSADAEGARAVAVELGYLPLALALAAAVIADQHLGYGSYLDRLRGMPVGGLLRPVEAGQYARGVAAAVLVSLEGVRAGDDTGICFAAPRGRVSNQQTCDSRSTVADVSGGAGLTESRTTVAAQNWSCPIGSRR